MSYKSSSELKALARERLKGKYGMPMGAVVLTMLISLAASFTSTFLIGTETTLGWVIYYLITLIVSLLTVVLEVGLLRFFLNFNRSKEYRISDLFWSFQNHPDKVILYTILVSLLVLVCSIPATVFVVLYIFTQQVIFFVLSVIGFIGMLVLSIIIGLIYSQAVYLFADENNRSTIETMRESREMMKGHKGRLFYLSISFIGWYLLSVLSCGIALLWIVPYINCTMTYFYMDLKGEFQSNIIDERI
ncbi:DUF975 family protein [Konateibacter massiliensis]|uniref:DUF975 family protein n=1 Tax=Konateibacter massiliensis TaxID=2002841 RepID=UPI000C15F1A5|nr:DUF975 family protein [Konateibacter massiliensis]